MNNLQEWIKDLNKNIKAADNDFDLQSKVMSGFRRLQLRLNPLIFADINSQTKLLAYFLSGYIDTIHMDLCGDTPDDSDGRLQNVRVEFFRLISETLKELEVALDSRSENLLLILEKFVELYSRAVNKLNYFDNQ